MSPQSVQSLRPSVPQAVAIALPPNFFLYGRDGKYQHFQDTFASAEAVEPGSVCAGCYLMEDVAMALEKLVVVEKGVVGGNSAATAAQMVGRLKVGQEDSGVLEVVVASACCRTFPCSGRLLEEGELETLC